MAWPPGPVMVNDAPSIVLAVMAWSNAAVTSVAVVMAVAPSCGEVWVTIGGAGGTVVNVHWYAAAIGVSSSALIPVVSTAVYAVPVSSAAFGLSTAACPASS